jgi:hypothetical protein
VTRRLLTAAGLLGPAVALAFPLPPLAPAAEVRSIAGELDLPSVLPPTGPAPVPLARMAFPAAALKGYAADVPIADIRKAENAEKFRFRRAVLAVLDECREGWANDGRQLRPTLPADISIATKADLQREQDVIAFRVTRLEAERVKLDALESLREREPKRWQAHYDLARAELAARLAMMHEYNLLLGQARQENLPALDPARHTGYRLRPADRMTGRGDVRALAREAKTGFQAVIENHPDTPWAVAARWALAAPPGLAWEPVGKE